MNGASGWRAPHLLSVEAVTVRFEGVTALSDVSFAVRPGELFAIIGPNGAGKTSLFNVLSRVYQPASGRVTFRWTRSAQGQNSPDRTCRHRADVSEPWTVSVYDRA